MSSFIVSDSSQTIPLYPSRADHMNGTVDFATYYRAVARTAGINYAHAEPAFLARVKAALDKRDEHLNTIPLGEGDRRGAGLFGIAKAFKAHGDCDSLAGRVCLLKQAARDAVQEAN